MESLGVSKQITSLNNASVKEAARLARKRYRYERRLFLTEGEDLLEAALTRGELPKQVFLLEDEEYRLEEAFSRAGIQVPAGGMEIFSCSPQVMEKLSGLGSGSRVISIFGMPDRKFPGALAQADISSPVLYLAGVGDPGNVGTLLRTAAAMGAGAVLLGPDTADPYSPKSLRATMGAIFALPLFLTVNAGAAVSWAESHDVRIVCADAKAELPVWDAPLDGAFLLVLGSEREGIPHRLTDAASASISIPQQPGTESLNVAMAGTAILYEALRQRSARGRGGDGIC